MSPAKKKTTAKKDTSAKTDRPSFSAPTPPEKSKEVVTNAPDPDKLTENEDVYVEEINTKEEKSAKKSSAKKTDPDTSEPDQSQARTITRDKLDDDSPLEQMLDETAPDTPAEEPSNDKSEDKDGKLSADKDSEEDMPEESTGEEAKSGSKNLLVVGLLILLIIFAGAGWGLYLNQVQPDLISSIPSLESPTPTPEPTSIPEPTPTPAPSIVVEILNGSGVAGATSDTQEKMEDLGYTVSSIGNAGSSDYGITEVAIVSGFTRTEELMADLEKNFGEATTSGELSEDSEIDARITLGSNWFEEE